MCLPRAIIGYLCKAVQDVPSLGHNKVILLGRDDMSRRTDRIIEPYLGQNRVRALPGGVTGCALPGLRTGRAPWTEEEILPYLGQNRVRALPGRITGCAIPGRITGCQGLTRADNRVCARVHRLITGSV